MKDDIYTHEYPTSKAGTFMVVRVYYSLGGMNYFAGASEPRGYYMSVGPEEIRDGMRSFAILSGVKQLLLGAARKSPKQAAAAIDLAMHGPVKDDLLARMCAKHGVTLTTMVAVDR